jgi:titin
MGSARFTLLIAVAALLAGCQDPMAPEPEVKSLALQGGPPSAGEPSAWASSPTQINLSWPDNSNNEAGWEIHRSTTGREGAFSLLDRTAANVTSYSNVELKALTEYCYRVRSFRTNGRKTLGEFLATVCATTLGPPEAAASLSATPALFGAVDIAWTTGSFSTNGFRVQRAATIEGPWVDLKTLASWERSYDDTGRAVEQQVCYRVVAFNTWGETPSDTDCTTPPAEPRNLAATSPDEQHIALTWEDRSAAEDGYEVQRAGDDFVWSVIATLPADASAYSDGGLTVNTRYWYRVRATKDGGFSYFSETISATTIGAPPTAPFAWAGPSGSSSVSVSWWDSPLAEGFRLERSTDDEATWVSLITTTAAQGWFDDVGRSSEQRVCYRVFAFNRLGDSPASNSACTTPPAAPSELRVTSIDDQTNEISWRDHSGVEDGFELWVEAYYEGWWEPYYYAVPLAANTTSLRVAANEYPFAIAAVKDGGYSDWVYPNWAGTSTSSQSRVRKAGSPPASAQRQPPVLKGRQTP